MNDQGKLEAVTGDLGGGKTAYAIERAYEHIARGGWVQTNIEFFPDENYAHPGAKLDNFKKRLAEEGLEFDPARLVRLEGDSMAGFHRQLMRGSEEMTVLVIIDEAQLDLHTKDRSKGQKGEETKDELYNFVAMCRKLDIELLFIAHDANEIDVNIRRKISVETTCRNLKEQRIFGGLPFPLPFYFRVRFKLYQGKVHHKIDSDFFLKSPAWGLYNSKALLGAKAQVFANMKVARATRLNRIKRPAGFGWAEAAAAAVAAFLCVF